MPIQRQECLDCVWPIGLIDVLVEFIADQCSCNRNGRWLSRSSDLEFCIELLQFGGSTLRVIGDQDQRWENILDMIIEFVSQICQPLGRF